MSRDSALDAALVLRLTTEPMLVEGAWTEPCVPCDVLSWLSRCQEVCPECLTCTATPRKHLRKSIRHGQLGASVDSRQVGVLSYLRLFARHSHQTFTHLSSHFFIYAIAIPLPMPVLERFRLLRSHDRQLGDPHNWELPSSYPATKSNQKHTVIPDQKAFANVYVPPHLQSSATDVTWVYPNASHAAVHLALLECFRNLRLGAISLDVKVSCCPTYDSQGGVGNLQSPVKSRQSAGWDTLIKLAVTRFVAWWSNIDRVLIHARAYGHHAGDSATVQLDKNHLPPLDVLLVWYTFMLDTNAYRGACRGREDDVPKIRKLSFPWAALLQIINLDNMQFSLPSSAQNLFSTLTGQHSDILKYLQEPPVYAEEDTQPIWIDLATQIQNNGLFIDEAHRLLWIRSPALNGTLARSIKTYFELEPKILNGDKLSKHVPFSIDLIRRTHRLFPEQYDLFLAKVMSCGPSDFKAPVLASSPLSEAAGSMKSISENCFCWTCERIRDDLPNFVYTTTASTASGYVELFALPQDQVSTLSSVQLKQIRDDLGFYTAVENARTKGIALPTRPSTTAQKEADKIAKARQDEAGYLPGLNEYIEVLPDGTRKVRSQKSGMPWGNLGAI